MAFRLDTVLMAYLRPVMSRRLRIHGFCLAVAGLLLRTGANLIGSSGWEIAGWLLLAPFLLWVAGFLLLWVPAVLISCLIARRRRNHRGFGPPPEFSTAGVPNGPRRPSPLVAYAKPQPSTGA